MPVNIPITLPSKPTPPPMGTVSVSSGQVMIFNGHLWIPLGTVLEEVMVQFRVEYKAHNVNSKRIVQRIVGAVQESANEFIVPRTLALTKTYEYEQLVEYLDAVLEDMCEDKQVNKYNIVGDFRNNPQHAVQQGTILIDVLFQQFNCLNTTKVLFTLTRV